MTLWRVERDHRLNSTDTTAAQQPTGVEGYDGVAVVENDTRPAGPGKKHHRRVAESFDEAHE